MCIKKFRLHLTKTLSHHYKDWRTWINRFTEHSPLRLDSYETCKYTTSEIMQGL
jgi:hypothetical protein